MSARNRFLLSALLVTGGVTAAGIGQAESMTLLQVTGGLLVGVGFLLMAYEDERKQK